MSLAPATPPNDSQVKRRIQQLRRQMEGLEVEVIRPPNAITPKQLALLVTLIREYGRELYHDLKSELGIDAYLSAMTKRQAWLLIREYTHQEDSPDDHV